MSTIGVHLNAADISKALGGRPLSKGGFTAKCPAHDDSNPSLSVCDGEHGPLVHCHAGCPQTDVIAELQARDLWPVHGAEPHEQHPQLGRPSSHWDYFDATARLVMRICRWDRAGGKEIRPQTLQAEGWRWKQFEKNRPVYALPTLLSNRVTRVLLVEGDKTADAAAKIASDMLATTWSGGAKAIEKTDWEPLRGRDVTLLADNDVPGAAAMDRLAVVLSGLGCAVRRVDLSSLGQLPKGWDCADALGDKVFDIHALWDLIEHAPLLSRATAEQGTDADQQAAWQAAALPGIAQAKPARTNLDPSAVAGFRRIEIRLEPGQLHNYAAAAERLLAPEIYVRGQQLVRIGKAPELQVAQPDDLHRDDSQAVVVPVGVEFLRRRLTELAEFQAWRRREEEWVPIDCPKELASNIAGVGDWPQFKGLDSISTAPFLRPDHTLCDVQGYDRVSRVFLAPNATFPALRANPTKQDAQKALHELAEPFSEFPFASEEAKSAFLSHLLTSAARHAIDVAPLYSYTAPLPGTGKSLLASMAARIEIGAMPPVKPFADDSEELRKVLFAALLAGDTTLLLDNVPNGQRVRSPILCGFVTASVYSDRKLGVSEAPSLPNRCTVVMTGNNISAAGDLARRCINVRLDVNAESVRGRDFKIEDLGAYVVTHRPRLLAAALTIIRAYIVAGYPKGFRPLPSFEQWSRLARDPLTWLGCADPVDTQEQEADDELGPLRAAFAALAALPLFAKFEFTARQVAQFCGGYGEDAQGLREIIEAAGCSDASSATKIGYWLRASRDRVAEGLKLRHRVAGQGVAKWKLELV